MLYVVKPLGNTSENGLNIRESTYVHGMKHELRLRRSADEDDDPFAKQCGLV
jgi:hypothetical protein